MQARVLYAPSLWWDGSEGTKSSQRVGFTRIPWLQRARFGNTTAKVHTCPALLESCGLLFAYRTGASDFLVMDFDTTHTRDAGGAAENATRYTPVGHVIQLPKDSGLTVRV